MTDSTSPEFSELKHKVFVLLYETSDLLLKSEDAVYAEFGLSQQQYLVLLAIESSSDPFVRIIDVAQRLKRNSNSISMIIDRMGKSGLVERIRDLPDRRSVHLVLTDKGKEKLYQASKVGWRLTERLTSSFSVEELETFVRLLEKLREKSFGELHPGEVIQDVGKADVETVTRLLKGL
ncbi:MarR family winged helix-turn-helix transcriptional regulator [Chloroflexota bacterium]